ncbi:hypothetical protein [Actinokineospora enzanensis]|uniref:hypothetical protein n=1 Tax=Actinokineospora enzanensis TaxID=155975 RepID=UPI000372A7AF|nr:hypothetical protein [Actinokineospora enzanensis]
MIALIRWLGAALIMRMTLKDVPPKERVAIIRALTPTLRALSSAREKNTGRVRRHGTEGDRSLPGADDGS